MGRDLGSLSLVLILEALSPTSPLKVCHEALFLEIALPPDPPHGRLLPDPPRHLAALSPRPTSSQPQQTPAQPSPWRRGRSLHRRNVTLALPLLLSEFNSQILPKDAFLSSCCSFGGFSQARNPPATLFLCGGRAPLSLFVAEVLSLIFQCQFSNVALLETRGEDLRRVGGQATNMATRAEVLEELDATFRSAQQTLTALTQLRMCREKVPIEINTAGRCPVFVFSTPCLSLRLPHRKIMSYACRRCPPAFKEWVQPYNFPSAFYTPALPLPSSSPSPLSPPPPPRPRPRPRPHPLLSGQTQEKLIPLHRTTRYPNAGRMPR